MLTFEDAERIRLERGLNPEQFSVKLGFSATAYHKAMSRKKISRWMAKEISKRFHVKLAGNGG